MKAPMPLDEARLRELWLAGTTITAMAAEFRCSRAHVCTSAQRIGLTPRATNTSQLPQAKIVAAYVTHGLSCEKIRKQLLPAFPKVSSATICRILKQRGVKIRDRYRRDKPGLIDECVRLKLAGFTWAEIGAKLHLSPRQVGLRLQGRIPSQKRGGSSPLYDGDEIRRLREKGLSFREIDRRVGCSVGTAHYHCTRSAGFRAEQVAS